MVRKKLLAVAVIMMVQNCAIAVMAREFLKSLTVVYVQAIGLMVLTQFAGVKLNLVSYLNYVINGESK